MTGPARRDVLRMGALMAGGLPLLGGVRPAAAATEGVAARVRPPRFRDAWFPITDFGASGDGTTDCTRAIDAAIKACHAAGGGHVLVPAGRWATGAIHLLSGVDLHVDKDATVLFSTDPAAYLPVVLTRWQGVEAYNYSPLIYAYGQRDIAVTGGGVLDAQGDNAHWWSWVGSGQYGWRSGMPNQRADWAALEKMGENGTPVDQRVFGAGHYLRPSFIQPYACENVLIEGVTLRHSPMWNIHPVLCRNVTVSGVTIDSLGPNGDGCDPDSCQDVVIRNTTFATHDDCIAIKSGRDQDGRRVGVPSKNILIEDCVFLSGGGAVAIGSEMSAGVSDVVARRLSLPFDASIDEASVSWILSVKSTSTRGGYMRDITVTDVSCPAWTYVPFEVTYTYMGGGASDLYPDTSHITVWNWSVGGPCDYPYRVRGVPAAPVRDVRLTNLTFEQPKNPPVVENADVTTRHVTT
ncbi:glycoside hydrolase family 28 protein [Actinoallomurus soli]|uniref:glycoside hydrolase family 28 protein n=1 Tax=Actinoallomurus soli TaxID=2952535 RepID=UPI00209332E7|nr:glycoside hydrolase family 28 protein [Actinoallomurus soli]MCO5968444.1 glycoside hydrolase family 28 protein [Actinoallomurus soli]